MKERGPRSILLGLTGLGIGGGIASVSRCIDRTLREDRAAGRLERIDRVLLLEKPAGRGAAVANEDGGMDWRCSGSQTRFFVDLWRAIMRTRPDFVVFDHMGLARALLPGLPVPRPDYGVFVHGAELVAASHGARLSALSGASVLMANSPHTAEAIRTIPALSHRSVSVIPLCIEPERLQRWAALRDADATRDRKDAVLIVGRMVAEEPGKGHEALIGCWARVRERVPTAELWIVGEGDDRKRLEKMVDRSGQADRIRFLGAVSDEKLSELYRTASIFAMPSRQEGFGLVYLEAMWHGLPCIGSTADAAACLIDDSCGRLVPYGDVEATGYTIVALLSNPVKRDALGSNGRNRATREFIFERFAEHLRQALGIDV
jgi:phosphatidylinositol alpha-1,6-mannosyltransferase